jgi:hypothetical protein
MVGLLPAVVRAEQPYQTQHLSDAIRVQPGATCLEKSYVVEQTHAWLGTDRVDVRLRVDIAGSADKPRDVFIAVLRVNEKPTTRRFAPGPALCAQLHAVVGLAIAIAINAAVLEAEGIRETKPVPIVEPLRWNAGLDASASYNALRGLGLGGALRFAVRLGTSFDTRLSLFGLHNWNQSVEDEQGRFFTVVIACRIDGCIGSDLLKWVRLHACMGVAAGPLVAWGDRFEKSEWSVSPWVAVANAGGVQFRINRFIGWSAEATFFVPLLRTIIDVRNASDDVVAETKLSNPGIAISVGPELYF